MTINAKTNIYWFLYYCVIVSALAFTIMGFQFIWFSRYLDNLVEEREISKSKAAWISSMFHIGVISSATSVSYFVNRQGRQQAMVLTCVPHIMATILFTYAHELIFLYLSRFLCGLAFGVTQTIVPVYVSEIAHTKNRGACATCLMVMLALGSLIANLSIKVLNIHRFSLIIFLMSCIHGCGIFFVEESPHFYVKNGEDQLAQESLERLRGFENVTLELIQLKDRWELVSLNPKSGVNRKTFSILLLILCVSQVAYAPMNVYRKHISHMSHYSVLSLTSVFVIFTSVSAYFVDKCSSRFVFLTSMSGSTVCLCLEGTYHYLEEKYSDFETKHESLHVLVEFVYLIIYAFGVVSSPYVFVSEQFDINTRDTAGLMIALASAIFGFIFIHLEAILQTHEAHDNQVWACVVILIVCCVIGYFVTPDGTTRKSFEEIKMEGKMDNSVQSAAKVDAMFEAYSIV